MKALLLTLALALPASAAVISTGITAPLDGFGDAFQVPGDVGALLGLSNKLDVGLRLTSPLTPGAGTDVQQLDTSVNFRL